MAEQSKFYGTIANSGGRAQRSTGAFTPVDPFADRASLIVRALLDAPADIVWTVRGLAAASTAGVATTSRVLQQLARYGVVTLTRRGRTLDVQLTNATALLDRWLATYHWTHNTYVAFAVPIGDPLRFVRRLPDMVDKHTRWALTMHAGAALIAPHATWTKVHMYVDAAAPEDLVSLGATLDGSPDPAGQLVLMRPVYTSTVWDERQTIDGISVVDDLQLILDLWNYPLRGREQAEHLIEWRMHHTVMDRPDA